MRILYIITQGEHGGGQKNVLDLALGMKNKNHEVFVAVGNIENEGDKWLHQELEKFGILKENLLEIKNLQREINFLKAFRTLKEIRTLENKIQPDVVHLHSVMAGTVGAVAFKTPPFFEFKKFPFKKGRKPYVVYTVHGFTFLEPLTTFKKYFYILSEFVASFFRDFTILISERDIQAGKKFFLLGKNHMLVHNGLDENIKHNMLSKEESREFIMEKLPPLTFGKDTASIVGTISNLYKTKGLEFLIDAAKRVVEKKQNTVFVVFGFGEEKYKKELLEGVKKNNLENHFFLLGKVDGAYKYLKALNVFTLTSRKEGLPYCLLEAKLAGLPIVASSVGGIVEMSKSISMDLVNVGDVEAIAREILENIKNKKSQDPTLPQEYSLGNMLEKVEKVYLR